MAIFNLYVCFSDNTTTVFVFFFLQMRRQAPRLLTMLFASLRLTAVIARTPSADSEEEDSWDED